MGFYLNKINRESYQFLSISFEMPPKKGKDKPAKKKEKEKEDLGPPVSTEKELQLQTELDELQEKLTILKSEVESLRKENDFLNEEAGQTRTESHEYMSFMAKKTNKRQTPLYH